MVKKSGVTNSTKVGISAHADGADLFPANLEHLEIVKSLEGGTASTFKVRDTRNQKEYVLKCGANEAQMKVEILMNVLYKRLGVPVPNVEAYHELPAELAKAMRLHETDRTVQLAEWIEPNTTQDDNAIVAQARRDFSVHALMGNIDASKAANFIQDQKGYVKLIDAGANYLFRSLGERRQDKAIEVSEIDSMRDPKLNTEGSDWFASLKEKEIQSQVQALMSKHDIIQSTIWELSEQLGLPSSLQHQLLANFSHRLDNLVQRFGYATQPFAKRDKAAIADTTSAGVMHLERNAAGELCVLLSKRVNHNWCDNFGGKSDAEDHTLARTAQRETNEESKGYLHYSDRQLAEASFHDIISKNANGQQQVYRMYLIEGIEPIELNKLKDDEHTEHYWVPLKNIKEAINSGKQITEEQQTTLSVKDSKGNDVIIFPPLYAMLKQEAVKTMIDSKLQNKKGVQRTQGVANHPESEKLNPDNRNLYRPITSPAQVKTDITLTSLRKAKVLDEIKHKQSGNKVEPKKDEKESEIASVSTPCQSERHLKAVMGEDFDSNRPIENNLRIFLNKYDRTGFSENEKETLIKQAAEMIAYEKKHPDQAFFYHGASDQIAYAYSVYQSLYRTLAADSSCDTMRADNALFHTYLSMPEFIAHFQSLSRDGSVNNYAPGYMESALSTNVFLFGNHETEGSYTVGYFTQNQTAKKIPLDSIFFESFRSMGVNENTIKKIVALAGNFPHAKQGALYQISIAKDEVDRYAYASGEKGVLKPFYTEGRERVSISKLLEALDTNQLNKEYIASVQARVMVPPNTPMKTRVYHWGDPAAEEMQNTFNKKLEKLAQDAAFDILNNRHQLTTLNTKTALMRNLPSIDSQAGLHEDTADVDQLVIRMIEFGEFENLEIFVTAHPEYIDKKLISKSKDVANASKESNNGTTILERLLAVPNSGKTVRKIFGELFYQEINLNVPFYQIIAAIDKSRKYQYASQAFSNGRSAIDLAKALHGLDEEDRVRFATENIFSTKKVKIKNSNELFIVLKEIPVEKRLDFFSLFLDDLGQSVEDRQFIIRELILEMPSSKKLEAAIRFENDMTTGTGWAYVTYCLEGEDKLSFANRNSHKITDAETLSYILAYLPNGDRFQFAIVHLNKINDEAGLSHVLSRLPDRRSEFEKHYRDMVSSLRAAASAATKPQIGSEKIQQAPPVPPKPADDVLPQRSHTQMDDRAKLDAIKEVILQNARNTTYKFKSRFGGTKIIVDGEKIKVPGTVATIFKEIEKNGDVDPSETLKKVGTLLAKKDIATIGKGPDNEATRKTYKELREKFQSLSHAADTDAQNDMDDDNSNSEPRSN